MQSESPISKATAKMHKPSNNNFDILLYGATSFVGNIITAYLAEFPQNSFSWAIAGRDEQKLIALKNTHNLKDLPHFVADAADEKALTALSAKTKVIISTVGPYALYGETLVKVCAQTGTDYCDLTGEPQWIKEMLDKYEEDAKASGARIVNSAGFDSIPSDLGVYLSQHLAIEKTGQPASHIKMRVRKIKGGASGGTIASMLNVMREVSENPELQKTLANPYVLCGADSPFHVRQKNHKSAEFDKELGIWTMPFVMAAINERIVHRSNLLLNTRYGEAFKYDEAMSSKTASTAWITTLGLGAFVGAASISPLRHVLANYILPKPGEGPSPEEQKTGMYDMRFYATLNNGEKQVVQVTGDRDPGYGSTAKMLSQVAFCLSQDVPELEGGFWTPAAGLGDKLIDRLKRHAGVVVSEMR